MTCETIGSVPGPCVRKRLPAVRAIAVLGAVLALTTACAPAAEGAEKLLSRNATYQLRGAGYVYTGQIQPGVNERAERAGMVYAPLVETTDPGDALLAW